MYVLSGCDRKRRGCLFSQLRSRAKCSFYASKNRQKARIHARMYGMLKGKKKPAGNQGSRLPHQIITRARGGRERRRLRAGKTKIEKAVTFCNPPTTLSLSAVSHQLCSTFKERQVATVIKVEKTVGAEATMWRRLHRVVFVVLGFSYLVNGSKNL